MSTNYIVMFTAGGRLKGAKIGEAEKHAMYDYLQLFIERFPHATINEQLGMAEVELTPTEVEDLTQDPQIQYVVVFKPLQLASTIQTSAPWHLKDISGSQYETYEYTTAGKDIPVYIVDTGIDVDHQEFESRAIRGFYSDEPTSMHGTHVAGIVGSKTYGVAKQCKLVSVQVFNPSFPDSVGAIWLLQGLNWLLDFHVSGDPGVVNISLGGPAEPITDAPYVDAILALIAEGLIVVVAAGNETLDTNDFFPGNIPEVITVGASDSTKNIASFSNYGTAVDIFAPGVDILSTSLNFTTETISGTSMASPVVAGICARYLELVSDVTQSALQARIKQYGVSDIILTPEATAASTTTKGIRVNMPGVKTDYKTTLSKALDGQLRRYHYAGATKTYETDFQYNEVKRLAVLTRFSSSGTLELATEITKVTLPDVPPPTVVPPVVLPPPIDYDGSQIVVNAGFTITYRGTTYTATTQIGTLYTYNYPGFVVMSLDVLPNNAYVVTTLTQLPTLPNPINIDGGTIVFNSDRTITFKGNTYAPTSIVNGTTYNYNYPGVVVVVVTTTTATATPQRVPIVIPPPVIPQDAPIVTLDNVEQLPGVWTDVMEVKLYPANPTVTKFSPVRVIAIDVADPNELSAYSLNLQFVSGTFNYSGLGFTMPANKTPVTVQGHNGIVERVANNAARGQAPQTVEGRLLPVFSAEMIYVNKYVQTSGTPYESRDIVAEIAAAAGTAVTFSATNNKLKSFEYTGRFTSALEQLADLSCGRLLQQNGHWMIIPKHTSVGSFTVLAEDLISWNKDVQSDILDMIASLMGYLKDAILARDLALRLIARIQNKLNNLSTLEKLPTDPTPADAEYSNESWQPMGEISFQFGYNGKLPLVQMNENILVETHPSVDAWDYWAIETSKSSEYWKREVTHERDSMGSTVARMRGLKSLDMTTLYYPFTPPSGASGLYRATGKLMNLYCLLWAGTETMYWSMSPVMKSQVVTSNGVTETPFNQVQYYFEFERAFLGSFPQTPGNDKKLYSAKMQLEYLPMMSMPWKFSVTIAEDYRLIGNTGYMLPIAGGSILNKNGNAVAEFDRTARVIKLQDGTIVSVVTCQPDYPVGPAVVDPITGISTFPAVVKGLPTGCTAPVATPGGSTVTIVGSIDVNKYVLKTQTGRLFGTIDRVSGVITQSNGSDVGYYTNSASPTVVIGTTVDPLWTKKLGYVYSGTSTVGVVSLSTPRTAASIANAVTYGEEPISGGVVSFSNAVAYPTLTPDANYSSLMSTVLRNELAAALVDKEIAEAKIVCIKKELDYYGVSYATMEAACLKWKTYYDAIELRDFPAIVVPPAVPAVPPTDDVINNYEVLAVAATGGAMADVNGAHPREQVVSVTYLYDNVLPLAGNALTVTTIPGTGISSDGGIIETVAFNGQTVTITAKKGYTA